MYTSTLNTPTENRPDLIEFVAKLPLGFTATFQWSPRQTEKIHVVWEPNVPVIRSARKKRSFLSAYERERDVFVAVVAAEMWRERHPIGCKIDRLHYAPQWRVLRICVPPGDCPDMRLTIDFATKNWPRVARVVCMSGDRPSTNYVKRAGEWEALRPDDAGYVF